MTSTYLFNRTIIFTSTFSLGVFLTHQLRSWRKLRALGSNRKSALKCVTGGSENVGIKGPSLPPGPKESHRAPSGTESADAQDNIGDKRTLRLALGLQGASILSCSGLRCVVPFVMYAAHLSNCFPCEAARTCNSCAEAASPGSDPVCTFHVRHLPVRMQVQPSRVLGVLKRRLELSAILASAMGTLHTVQMVPPIERSR